MNIAKLSFFVCFGALACAPDANVGNPFGDGSETVGESLDGSGSADSASGSASMSDSGSATNSDSAGTMTDSDTDNSTSGTDTGPLLDIGGETTATAEGGTGEACEKIDFLFILDNSGSMSPHQQNMVTNFPAFIDTIAADVEAMDYQIMVLDTDGAEGGTNCETALGSGQVGSCNVPDGKRFLTSDLDISTISSIFSCLGNVGTSGDANEMPMSALVEALTTQNEVGACNEGFIRDDAVLVVTIISDDHPGWFGDDNVNGFGGTPSSWFNAVVTKKGTADNAVILGLYATLDDQSCIGFGPEESGAFIEFTEMFGDHGLVHSVCDPDYNQFFQDAVALIDTACDEFEPID